MQDCDVVRRKVRALATERNETSKGYAVMPRMGLRSHLEKDETTDPQGARANRLRFLLQEKRVARIAECRLKQKMGYGRHTTSNKKHVSVRKTFSKTLKMPNLF